MDILETIISFKKKELLDIKRYVPVRKLENSIFFRREMPSFYESLAAKGPSLIGEFKRKSPSLGTINTHAKIEQVAKEYVGAGVSAMSVLTDKDFFGGEKKDLTDAASVVRIPILRKDFIIDEYQIVESKSLGAAAILLIAKVLSRQQVEIYTKLAHNLGMHVLFEIHDMEDLDKMVHIIKIIGINNRNLKTFKVDVNLSAALIRHLPAGYLKVAESGIHGPGDVKKLYDLGFNAFLIGEHFMKAKSPGRAASEFMKDLRKIIL